jgi:hypothetical protein
MGLARRGIANATGRRMAEPLSGQRAVRWEALPVLLPFAPGFGIEVAMTIDALRAGLRVVEVEVDLHHNPTGKDLSGILHRARQARAISRELTRRRAWRPAPNGTVVPVDAGSHGGETPTAAGSPDPKRGHSGETPTAAGSPDPERGHGGGTPTAAGSPDPERAQAGETPTGAGSPDREGSRRQQEGGGEFPQPPDGRSGGGG